MLYQRSKLPLLFRTPIKSSNANTLSAVGTLVNFSQVCDSINSVLASSLQNIHQGSLMSLQNHMASHVKQFSRF